MDPGIDSTNPLSILSTEFSLAGNTSDCSCHRNPSVFWLLLAWKIFLIWQITFKLELRILFIEATLPTLLFQFPLLSPLRSAALVCWKYFLVHCSEKCQGQLNYNWLHSQHNSGQYYSSMEKHKYSTVVSEAGVTMLILTRWGDSDNWHWQLISPHTASSFTPARGRRIKYSSHSHYFRKNIILTRRKFQNMLLGSD